MKESKKKFNYRIYVNKKYYDTKLNEELMFSTVDELIELYDNVIVIEHNIEENWDFPLFSLYSTDKEKYYEMRGKKNVSTYSEYKKTR